MIGMQNVCFLKCVVVTSRFKRQSHIHLSKKSLIPFPTTLQMRKRFPLKFYQNKISKEDGCGSLNCSRTKLLCFNLHGTVSGQKNVRDHKTNVLKSLRTIGRTLTQTKNQTQTLD